MIALYILAGIVLILAFFVPILAYRAGLRQGIELGKGKQIEPLKSPIKAIQAHRQVKKPTAKENEFMEGLNNLLNYDGTPQTTEQE